MARLLIWAVVGVLGACILMSSHAYAAPERRVALVIGNSGYKDNTFALANPKNDAISVADVLKSLDFEVQLVTNVGKREMDGVLERFARLSSNADSALFFYAGHAIQYNGKNFLMPIDAQLEDEISIRYNLVSLDDVRSSLDGVSGVKIMILDACRNNPIIDRLNRMANNVTRGIPSTRGLARIDKTQGMVIAYATAPDDVALDGIATAHSPYTTALIKEMQEPGLEIAAMFRRVGRNVNDATGGRQRPETSISLLNEYYLNLSDRKIWESMRETADIPQILEFLRRYPNSTSVIDAKYRLDILERAKRDREDEEARQQREALNKELIEQQAAVQAELRRLKEERRQADAFAAEREAQRQLEERAKVAVLEEQRKKDQQAAAERAARQQRDEQERLAKLEQDRQNAAQALAEKQAEQRRRAAEKLAALEQERVRAEQEAAAREEARRKERDNQRKAEQACKTEQSSLVEVGRDEAKLNAFVSSSSCAEVKLRAQSVLASLTAEREQAQRACDSESKQMTALMKAPGPEAHDELVELQSSLTCTSLNSKIVEAVGRMNIEIKRATIRNTQAELRRLGCYRGPENGDFNDSTKDALKRVSIASGKPDLIEIDDATLSSMKKLEGPVCDLPKPQFEEKPVVNKPSKAKAISRSTRPAREPIARSEQSNYGAAEIGAARAFSRY
ncbi:hypothetical protein ACVWXL_005884 [Bradyrhizobium sp. GM22.5]